MIERPEILCGDVCPLNAAKLQPEQHEETQKYVGITLEEKRLVKAGDYDGFMKSSFYSNTSDSVELSVEQRASGHACAAKKLGGSCLAIY